MDFAALFHALLLILSIPNKALNSLNSLLNAYPRTIGSPSPPPVITAIAYRYPPAVSTVCSFEAHGTTSPTYTAVTGQLDNVIPTSYNLTNAAPTTSLYTESHESSGLVVYEIPTARHFEYPTISNNAVRFWLLILIVVYLIVLALRHRCSVYEALQRSVKEQNDGLVKEKLTALTTISRADKALNMAVDELVAAYGEIGIMQRMYHERIESLKKDKGAALTTISQADTALNIALGDLAAAYGEIGTIEKEKLAAITSRIEVQAVCDRVRTRQDCELAERKQQLEEAVESMLVSQRSLAALQQEHLEDQERCDELEVKYATSSTEVKARDDEITELKQEKADLLLEVGTRDTKISEMEAKRRASLQVLQDARLQKSVEQKQRDQAVVAELMTTKLANATLVENMQAAEIEIGRREEQARVQFDAYASLQAKYTASLRNSATESTDIAAESRQVVVYDIDDFARTAVPFPVGSIDDSPPSSNARAPIGRSVIVRLAPGAKQDATNSDSTPDPESNTDTSSNVRSSSHLAANSFKQVSQAGDGRGTDSVSRTRDDGEEAASTMVKPKRKPGQGHINKRKLERLHLQPSYNATGIGHIAATAPFDKPTSQVDDSTYGSTSPQSSQAESSTYSEETDLLDGSSGQHEMGSTTISTGERRESAQELGEHGRSRVLGGGEGRMVAPRSPASMAPMPNWAAASNGGSNLRRGGQHQRPRGGKSANRW
ncbi:hypothetical protein LTR42_005885 [Elasticomyces elasticus]|nr:hypothetical protein LTR42_005885 [Elasticomyces elasticus]